MKCNLLVFFSLALALSACGKDEQSPGAGGTSGHVTKVIKIQGEEPETYYARFLYRTVSTCSKGMYYRFASSDHVKIGTADTGKDMLAHVQILMLEDRTYRAFYQEIDVYDYTDSGFRWDRSREKYLSGSWKVVEDRLVLENLGEATRLVYNERPAFVLKMSKSQISSGAANREFLVKYVMASYNPIPALDPCKY